MASIGHTAVDDRLHSNGSETTPNLQLTSCYLNFVCPVTQQDKVFELSEPYRPQFQL